MSDTQQSPEEQKSEAALRQEREDKWAEERRIRELPFAELTVDQKFARIIEVVRNLEYTGARVRTMELDIRDLQVHTHDNLGDVVVPIKHRSSGGDSVGMLSSAKMRHPLE